MCPVHKRFLRCMYWLLTSTEWWVDRKQHRCWLTLILTWSIKMLCVYRYGESQVGVKVIQTWGKYCLIQAKTINKCYSVLIVVLLFGMVAYAMRGSRKFCQRESDFENVFFSSSLLSWWGERGSIYHYEQAIIAPPSKWRFAGGPMMAQHWMLAWQLCVFSGDLDQYY